MTKSPLLFFRKMPMSILKSPPAAKPRIPRQQIATVGYALNSETLQGMGIGLSGIGYKNTVAVFDNQGNLNLGETSPSIVSTSGTLGIKGNAILFSKQILVPTAISISPLMAPALLTSIWPGPLPVPPRAFINATDANLASGTIYGATINNLNKGYNFLNFQNYSVGTSLLSRFSVDAYGNTNIGGTLTTQNISIGNTFVTAKASEA